MLPSPPLTLHEPFCSKPPYIIHTHELHLLPLCNAHFPARCRDLPNPPFHHRLHEPSRPNHKPAHLSILGRSARFQVRLNLVLGREMRYVCRILRFAAVDGGVYEEAHVVGKRGIDKCFAVRHFLGGCNACVYRGLDDLVSGY